MAIPLRSARPGTFFITSCTFNRLPFFQKPANAELFLETLQHYRRLGNYLLHDFVVMPDHVHLLLTPQRITLERTVQLVKGGFSHRVASSFPYGNEDLQTTAFATAQTSLLGGSTCGRIPSRPGWCSSRRTIPSPPHFAKHP
jgi:putative transposase